MSAFLSSLLWSALAAAAPTAEVDALQGMGRIQHGCVGRLPALEARREAGDLDRPQLLERALCLHAVGRYDQAIPALDEALAGAGTAALLRAQPRAEEALVVRAVLLSWRGRTTDAQRRIAELQRALGPDHPGTQRARAVRLGATGAVADAWTAAEAAWQAHPEDPHILALLAELTGLSPDAAPGWARAILGRSAQTLSRTNQAASLLTSGRYGRCAEVVAETLEAASDPAEVRRLRVLGHRCGAHGGDLKTANRHMMALRDLSALDGQAVLAHADLLAELDKIPQALRLLELSSVEDARAMDTRVIRWSLDLGRLDAAVAAAARGAASPESRATLGLALHRAGRDDEARPILEGACAELNRGAQTDCTQLLDRLMR